MTYRAYIKPAFDKVMAAILLALVSPVLILVIAMLWLGNNGRVWFRQERPGKHERMFYVLKFKTMNDAKDANGHLLPDDQRLTWMGRIVRKTSLDELPQLINVLRGEMSLVGPRPLLPEYLSRYNAEQRQRHHVTPGITGWAQVNGRNAISWKQKFEFDVWYVKHQSFWLDVKILFLTFVKVIKAEGISGENSATMMKFTGND